MKLVDFMIIGAMKSGTTSLAYHLSQHPSICFCDIKEPDYFSKVKDWSSKIGEYHGLFRDSPGQILGEASTMYTMLPENEGTAERIKEYNPSIKLIYIVRDPIERIQSHYAHKYVRKRVSNNVSKEIHEDPSYLNRSRYYMQISHYYKLFDPSQIMIVIFEDFIQDSRKVLMDLSEFLKVEKDFFQSYDPGTQKNSSSNRKILADGGMGRIFKPLKKIRHHLPDSLVNFGLSIFGNEIKENPELPEVLKKELYQELKADTELFKRLIKRDLPEWRAY